MEQTRLVSLYESVLAGTINDTERTELETLMAMTWEECSSANIKGQMDKEDADASDQEKEDEESEDIDSENDTEDNN